MSKTRVVELETNIAKANDTYYNNTGELVVDDDVYDAWVTELTELAPKSKLLKKVGAPVSKSAWKKATHEIPMKSLDKINLPEECIEWCSKRNHSDGFVVEGKLDGISLEEIYQNGKLVAAITRGDGSIGEDILVNVSKMQGVKATLPIPFTGSLRGEILLKKSLYDEHLSDQYKQFGRGVANGIAKGYDGKNCEFLNVIHYQAIGNVEFDTETAQLAFIQDVLGLDVVVNHFAATADDINTIWQKYQDTIRETLDYELDGLVVRVNNLEYQASLGEHDKYPDGAVAYKFAGISKETTVEDIIFQVGNSGKVTPVAIVAPTNLFGAIVTRASLYNMAYINRLGIDVGANVLICRQNDVIPRVTCVIKGTGSVMRAPDVCPECGTQLEEQGEYLVCPNTATCPAQMVGRIKNWINVLNLLEWGETLIERLVEEGLVTNVADLYKLTKEQVAALPRMGEKSADKVIDILHAGKELSLGKLIGGLSIPLIGESMVESLERAGYDTVDKLLTTTANEFAQVSGFGPTKANALYAGLQVNKILILDLITNHGITMKVKGSKLANVSLAFTGAMKNKRAVLKDLAINNGATVKDSVGAGLTYLVTDDPNGTSNKLKSARKNGTKLITEEEFLNMVGGI